MSGGTIPQNIMLLILLRVGKAMTLTNRNLLSSLHKTKMPIGATSRPKAHTEQEKRERKEKEKREKNYIQSEK